MNQKKIDPHWERDLINLQITRAWTPAQRVAWLEEALDFAMLAGAIEKTRRVEEELRGRGR